MHEDRTLNAASLDRALVWVSLLNALLVAALFASAILAGISQEPFQLARLPEANVQRLLINPMGLRINIGLDNGFIIAYSVFFTLLSVRLRSVIPPMHVSIALGAILITAILDMIENHHILVMLFSAEQSLPVSASESQWQMILSSVKFHVSYVAVGLFAFGFYRLGGWGHVIAVSLALIYIPLGLAIYMVSPELARPLIISRTLLFIVSFLVTSLLFSSQKHGSTHAAVS